ncbi:MAG TPA: hypothetical protein GXX38_08605 [Clostridia bacterium]|jgi:hypothetical protein|nr:hypothetical protein [Clostridia bacterium]
MNNYFYPKPPMSDHFYPICCFLEEMCVQFRYNAEQKAKGHSVLELEDGVLKVSTVVRNLIPLDPAVAPGYLFYRCWLNRVERDGTITYSLPIGVLGINAVGCGETFGQLALNQLGQIPYPLEDLNVITVTAEYGEGWPKSDGKLILAGKIPRRMIKFY